MNFYSLTIFESMTKVVREFVFKKWDADAKRAENAD